MTIEPKLDTRHRKPSALVPGAKAVRDQLERVLVSPDFASRRSRDLLCLLVEETLAGRGDDLTQAGIASRVFARSGRFDPAADPIVRIQAGRLRRSLERYYRLSGRRDAVRIELPRGAYVPVFRWASAAEAVAEVSEQATDEPADD
jgi:adenylate cyclase